ncbi:helix-turn-helix domain-containing protein [Enterobacter cancerogenus]|uniref:helix-turn-helix domain-containing protein n=1 Tax=Enterobacter cancerogenus TaxID=69218 RepID=UPI001299981B|nr:helix-turn-helix transcriptional regulator [Enterobacter cancerogenus]QGG11390.1 helix-turn-helix domain-containing protein [Enterobacter cancerogenus]
MSRNYAEKLRCIRKAEGLTQKRFAELTGLALGTIKKYETGHQPARAEVLESVVDVPTFEKYTLWLMTDKTAPGAGQISPTLSPDGQEKTESHHLDHKIG